MLIPELGITICYCPANEQCKPEVPSVNSLSQFPNPGTPPAMWVTDPRPQLELNRLECCTNVAGTQLSLSPNQ